MSRLKTAIVTCGILAALGAQAVRAQATKVEAAPPRIEVVFVLDTTGSMSGLIKAAKEKIWAVANSLASTKPAPEIKMGLVGFRDRGDAYITRVTDLTDDLDAVYTKLMAFRAGGGGDGPESVNQALHEAVTQVKWSTDDKTYRVIFLFGDSPPHMDYKNDVKYTATCKTAARKAIVINAVQCGSQSPTTPIWSDIARRAEGQYFRVEQSGGAILASTPFDKELAGLSRDLDSTRIYYGSREKRRRAEARAEVADTIYKKADVKAAAQRAVFNAGKAGRHNFAGDQELVQAVADGQVKVGELKERQLPEAMKGMSAKEREKLVAENLAKRKQIQARIKDLSAKRQAHIREQLRRNKLSAKGSLDDSIFNAVKTQAAKRGITYKGEAKY